MWLENCFCSNLVMSRIEQKFHFLHVYVATELSKSCCKQVVSLSDVGLFFKLVAAKNRARHWNGDDNRFWGSNDIHDLTSCMLWQCNSKFLTSCILHVIIMRPRGAYPVYRAKSTLFWCHFNLRGCVYTYTLCDSTTHQETNLFLAWRGGSCMLRVYVRCQLLSWFVTDLIVEVCIISLKCFVVSPLFSLLGRQLGASASMW